MIFRCCNVKFVDSFLKGTREDQGSWGQQLGQGNFELAANYDYIRLGQLTQA